MRALVTGSSGFIGSTLVQELASAGVEVHALLRKSSSLKNLKGLRFETREGDLSDQESLNRAVQGMDVIFHLAGAVTAPNREAYFEQNSRGTLRLAEAALNNCPNLKKFVFVSSLAASGPSTSLRPKNENDQNYPVSSYGESKLFAEKELLKLKDRLPLVIIRPPLVYGPKDSATFLFVKTAKGKWVPEIRGTGDEGHKYYTAIHSQDLCRGIRMSSLPWKTEFKSGEIFYLTNEQIFTFREMMESIASQLKVQLHYLPVPMAVVRGTASILDRVAKWKKKTYPLNRDKIGEIEADFWICSAKKSRETFGFEASFDLDSGWKDALGWYQKEGWI